jgi:hypothetical protein
MTKITTNVVSDDIVLEGNEEKCQPPVTEGIVALPACDVCNCLPPSGPVSPFMTTLPSRRI